MEGKEIEFQIDQINAHTEAIAKLVDGTATQAEVKYDLEVIRGIAYAFKEDGNDDLKLAGQKLLDILEHAVKIRAELETNATGSRKLRKRVGKIEAKMATLYRALGRVSVTLNERSEE